MQTPNGAYELKVRCVCELRALVLATNEARTLSCTSRTQHICSLGTAI